MKSVGALLKAEREQQGREVAEVAEELCITQRYLRAIEQDDLKVLPGVFFYRSFVRQYAAILGIDEARLRPGLDELTSSVEPVPANEPRYAPTTPEPAIRRTPIRDLDPIVRDGNRSYFGENRLGLSIGGLVAVLLACSGIYSWYSRAAQAPPAAKPVAKIVAPAPVAVEPVKAEAPPPAAEPPAPAAVNIATTTGPDGVNHVVLNLSATEKTWISIVCDGKPIFSGILQPSETKTLTGLEVAKMKVGNAAGLDVRWNGKPIGPIGPRGQVRVLLFTPENFQILQPNDAM